MSMSWMLMPGQTWASAAVSFLGMWIVMMVAMMLPSLIPMLCRYREAVDATDATRLGPLTALVGAGYFFTWTVFGVGAFPMGVAVATLEMQHPALSHAVPVAVGIVVLVGAGMQFTKWKAGHLACCREAPGQHRTLPANAATAWRHGLRLGVHCIKCCVGLMAVLLVIGVMDLRAMAVVSAAITVERLAPAGERVARAIGAIGIAYGVFLLLEAVGDGTRVDGRLGKSRGFCSGAARATAGLDVPSCPRLSTSVPSTSTGEMADSALIPAGLRGLGRPNSQSVG
jgi:predicted metal-binding membrane protein